MYDTHVHLVDPDKYDYPWIQAAPSALRRRWAMGDLIIEAESCDVTAVVLVQTHSSMEETKDFLRIADASEFVAGVVGWLDLTSARVADDLDLLRSETGGSSLVGLRHQVEDEADINWLCRPDVRSGLSAIEGRDITFDLLIRTRHLEAAVATVERYAGIEFILDHLAKPPSRIDELVEWEVGVRRLARYPNVSAKISGLLSESGPTFERPSRVKRAMAVAIDAFGPERLLIGSDWPISAMSHTYAEVLRFTTKTLSDLLASPEELRSVSTDNAKRIYSLHETAKVENLHPENSRQEAR